MIVILMLMVVEMAYTVDNSGTPKSLRDPKNTQGPQNHSGTPKTLRDPKQREETRLRLWER